MMELQNPHRDGLHLTKAVNIFVYRSLKSKLDELDLNPLDLSWELLVIGGLQQDTLVKPQLKFGKRPGIRLPMRSPSQAGCWLMSTK